MSTETLFVKAAKKKFRFQSGKGPLSVEDLFDLPLTALDAVAVALDEKVQKAGRKSFIGRRTESDSQANDELEVVKFVIELKMAEQDAAKVRADKAAQKTFLKDLLAKKQVAALEGLSAEEIQKQIEALGE